MRTKTAAIQRLINFNLLMAVLLMACGIFFLTKTVEAQATDVPGKIETLTAAPGTLSAILSWESPDGEPTSYTVEYGTTANGVFDQICGSETCIDSVAGAIVTNLQADLEYIFRVTPSNGIGTGESSNITFGTPTGPCSGLGIQEFCGSQIITAPILRFTNIPDSFDFPTINMYGTPITTENDATPEVSSDPASREPEELTLADYGKAQLVTSDVPGTITLPGVDISSNDQNVYNNSNAASQPALADLLGIQDTRDSGGFEVQAQASGTFSDGTHTIPLSNLLIATSIYSPVYSVPATNTAYPCPATNCGVIYGTTITEKGILAPADNQGNSLGMPGTYGANFGSSAIVLMDGGLPSTKGRNGYVYQFLNYYLRVPAFQAAGTYEVKLTFTLIDDTI